MPHLMDLLLCLMMVKLDLLHQCPVDLLQRYGLCVLYYFILLINFALLANPMFS